MFRVSLIFVLCLAWTHYCLSVDTEERDRKEGKECTVRKFVIVCSRQTRAKQQVAILCIVIVFPSGGLWR